MFPFFSGLVTGDFLKRFAEFLLFVSSKLVFALGQPLE